VGFIELRAPDRSVGRHVFVVMAGVGLDAQMLANTDDKLKAKIGWLAYVGAARKAMRDSGDLRLSYRVDHRRTVSVNANTLMVGNCGTLTGNVPLMPDANLDDGRFEMAILRPTSAFQWIQILGKVFWENGVLRRTKVGTLMTTKDVHALKYVKGREAIVKLDRLEKIELDGDEFGEVTEFSVTMAAAALTVRVTAD
jgi:diacylglycerol kinase family enzyme